MKQAWKIPEDVLGRPVTGLNLSPGTLRDQLGEGVNLLVFLRHFGCIFCRETLADVRAARAEKPGFPAPLFFFQGRPAEGRALLRSHYPDARAVADPGAEFYEAFGIGRGGLIKLFGPGVWSARSRAAAQGHSQGPRGADVLRMPGVFLARGPEVVWAHDYRHAGDRPDYDAVARMATELATPR